MSKTSSSKSDTADTGEDGGLPSLYTADAMWGVYWGTGESGDKALSSDAIDSGDDALRCSISGDIVRYSDMDSAERGLSLTSNIIDPAESGLP